MAPQELLVTSARAAAVYILMLVVVRALGKRTVGNFAAFDLLVALMLGEVVDEIIYGDVGFLQGTAAIGTLAGLAALEGLGSYANRGLQRILEGKPTVVLRDGQLDPRGMRAERINEADIMALLRAHGVSHLGEVRLATVETDGELSVLKHDWAEPATRADIDPRAREARELAREADLPSRPRRTDSPRALDEA